MLEDSTQSAEEHKWNKGIRHISRRMEPFTRPDDIVFDPFTGGGTIPTACKILGRNYIAFEIEPNVAEKARQRVQNTQPPLFVLQPSQMDMGFEGMSE